MCRKAELQKQIRQTAADLDKNYELANQPLESPECYALPAIAFVLGVALHKSLPSPRKILSITAKLLG